MKSKMDLIDIYEKQLYNDDNVYVTFDGLVHEDNITKYKGLTIATPIKLYEYIEALEKGMEENER